MTDYVVRDTQLTRVADAIRAKGGTSAPMAFPDGFVSAVQAFPDAVTLDNLSVTENGVYTPSSGHAYSEVTVDVPGGGGDTDAEDGIITRTISGSYYNSRVRTVGTMAFASCSSLTEVNFPNCTTIKQSAFMFCFRLSAVNFPACTEISSHAFNYCQDLQSVNFPVAKYISTSAFLSCRSLVTASFPECISIYASAFAYCSSLNAISFPACTSIYSYAFHSCRNLSVVSFPMLEVLSGTYQFYQCVTLLSVYLLGSRVPRLGSSNVFNTTPLSNYTAYTSGVSGSIFVRASLLTAFQSATNWSYYASRMVGLTDEEIEALDAQEGA